MNIVFWGEDEQSGTTAHMHAVAGMLAVRYRHIKPDLLPLNMEYQTYQVCDCGTGLNVKKRRMLWHADLVVVNLKQEKACIDGFFREHFHVAKNVMYLLDGSDSEVGIDEDYLQKVYRIEADQSAVIPFNNDYYQAFSMGKSASFIERENRMPGNLQNEEFIRILRQVTDAMVWRTLSYQEQIRREEEERNRPRKRRRRI